MLPFWDMTIVQILPLNICANFREMFFYSPSIRGFSFFFNLVKILLQVIHAIHKPCHRIEHLRERCHIIRTKVGRLLDNNRGPAALPQLS